MVDSSELSSDSTDGKTDGDAVQHFEFDK
jgi:hypothetical protein